MTRPATDSPRRKRAASGLLPHLHAFLRFLGVAIDEQGRITASALGCPDAQAAMAPCRGCRVHEVPKAPIAVKLGRVFGFLPTLGLFLTRMACRDGFTMAEWPPALFNQAARLPLVALFGLIHDCRVMSFSAAAKRHGVSRRLVADVFRAFCAAFWETYRPAMPPGGGYLALDVAHHGGRNHLFIAVVTPKGEKASRIIAVVAYSKKTRAEVITLLRTLATHHRIKAVAIDMSKELRALVREALPGVPIVIDFRHFFRLILVVMAKARHQLPPEFKKMFGRTPSGRKTQGLRLLSEMRRFRLKEVTKQELDLLLSLVGPEYTVLYRLKEAIGDWHIIKGRKAGKERLTEILNLIKQDPMAARQLGSFVRTCAEWETEILNMKDHRITTAFVENRIKTFKLTYQVILVSDAFDIHYVRTLLENGAMADEAIDTLAWQVAETYRPTVRQQEAA